jgi:hypothetical protein
MLTEICAGATGAQLTMAVARSEKASAFIAVKRETTGNLRRRIDSAYSK